MHSLQAVKEVKGILNKLTPEKFDILSKQLVQLVTNTDVLQSTITLIFENAVAQPTFVVVYADLCVRLAEVRIPACRPHVRSSAALNLTTAAVAGPARVLDRDRQGAQLQAHPAEHLPGGI